MQCIKDDKKRDEFPVFHQLINLVIIKFTVENIGLGF
jgi:hypothetical protein